MLERTAHIPCRSGRAELWEVIADTERFNREAQMPPMEIRAEASADGVARHVVKSHLGPFPAEWRERPFEWVEGRRYGVRRELISGPIAWLEIDVTFDDRAEGGTDVTYAMRIEPRGGAVSLVLGPFLGAALRQVENAIVRIDERMFAGAPPPIVDALKERPLAAAVKKLDISDDAKKWVPELVEVLRTAPDHAARRLRPYALADAWGAPRRDVLELCLASVVAGVLELTWNVVCPSCRIGSEQLTGLADLGEEGHCDLCDLSFGVELDRAVEAIFAPAPVVREVPEAQFCSGGPATMPHVLAQTVLDAHGEVRFVAPTEVKRHRLFARGGAVTSIDIADGAPESVTVALADAFEPGHIAVAPGGTILVAERAGSARHVKLERLEWASAAATAYDVGTIATYRQQFSNDVLRPGASVRIGCASLLFSDLSASTQLYTREGDAAAFRLVQDHFDLLSSAIGAHDGAVVKTIGDAVMAVFVDELAAVRAAVAMLEAWPAFVEGRAEAEGVELKIGVYAGACYAVTANGVLDYFGQTVNIAARLQGQADKSEIVVAKELAERAQDEADLGALSYSAPYPAELKGLDRAVEAVRVSVAAQRKK